MARLSEVAMRLGVVFVESSSRQGAMCVEPTKVSLRQEELA